MSGLIDKRKRSREDDVSCESTPLSKRINNLHLSNFEEAQYNQHPQQQQTQPHHGINNSNHIQHHLSKDMLMHHHAASSPDAASVDCNGVMKSMNGDTNGTLPTLYDPDLNEADNPYYYNKNKLLHELHLERMKRCTV